MKKQLLTLPQLEAFMESHGNIYKNSNGIDVHFAGGLYIDATLWDKSPVEFSICLSLDAEHPELMEALHFRSVEDIENLDYACKEGLAWYRSYIKNNVLRWYEMSEEIGYILN